MKLAVLCLCFLQLVLVSPRLSSRNDPQSSHRNLPVTRAQASRGAEPSNQRRVRPLFARRGQYEHQMIHVPKPKVVPVAPNNISRPAKVAPDPVKPTCSQLTQSCLPQSGCCDPGATCHCRFFNAICFCRRVNSQHDKKT